MNDKKTIRKAKQRILDEMDKYDPKSEEYARLSAQLAKLTESEKNQNSWLTQLGCGIGQTVVSAIASTINVWSVLKHEDRGNVVTTKSLSYAPKPKG